MTPAAPHTAPELAAAMAETRMLRDELAQLRKTASALADRWDSIAERDHDEDSPAAARARRACATQLRDWIARSRCGCS